MSAPQTIVIDSDDEPQAKKPKQDRSPLVLINGDTSTKRKQLTLKDLVSPKSKQSTLSNFKVVSPKVTGKQPLRTSPKENLEPSTNPSAAAKDTSPVRGVKRKSTFEGGEGQKTPVKQMKVSKTLTDSVEDSPKSAKITKSSQPKPALKSMLKRSPKQQNSKKTGNKPNAKLANKKDGNKPSTELANKKDGNKPSAELANKKDGNKPSTELANKKDGNKPKAKLANKKDAKPKENQTNAVLEVKPVKKRFGDYKKKDSVHLTCVEQKTTDKSAEPSSPVVPTEKPVTQNDPKTPEPITVGEDTEAKEENQSMESGSDLSETEEPSVTDKTLPLKIHLDGEKPGPSGIKETSAKKSRPLSEKQKKLQEERENKKREIAEEKERKRLEREKEKEAREEGKRVEQAKKDAEKQAREKAREEARLKKEEEKKLKEGERKQKEAEKDSEKKRKIQENVEEKRVKEEEQEKKRQKQLKEQEKFKSFFVVKKPTVVSTTPKVETLEKKFREFVITPTMSVAPITRTVPVTRDILSSGSVTWEKGVKHIRSVISEMRCKHKYETDQLSCDLEIISISNPKEVKVKRKNLQFYENHRPAYCGSWRKTSSVIGPRKPFGQDKTLLEYEYDSDEDWEEEEEEGEDITSEKEDEKEEEKENEDDDDDDGFFVPHGYLSDDEGDEDCGMTEEAKKKRIERRRKQFEEEQKSKESGILKAKIVGPTWQADISSPPSDPARFLAQFKAVWSSDVSEEPLDPFARIQPVAQMETSDSTVKNDKRELPVAGYGMLIRFLHGSPIGMSRAVETFQEMWHSDETRGKVSKRQLTQLIPTLVKKCMRPGNGMKLCWYASDEVLLKYELPDLVGLHCEIPEPVKPQPPPKPAISLLKFTKASSAEQDLALLRQQQSLQQALQQAIKIQQGALLLQQQQQQQQQQQPKVEAPQNTLKNFLTTSTVKQIPLIAVSSNHGNAQSSLGNHGNASSSVGNGTATPPSVPSLGVQKLLPSVQNKPGAPRRIALLPIKLVSSTPINIDDSN